MKAAPAAVIIGARCDEPGQRAPGAKTEPLRCNESM
jgi:hypothetical protein